jgi:hypothetical protein
MTIEDEALAKNILLASIKVAIHRCRLDENELLSVGLALSKGLITSQDSIEWLAELGLCGQVAAVIDGVEKREEKQRTRNVTDVAPQMVQP